MKKLIYILAFLFLTSCLSDKQLKESWWKHGDGYYIGDFIHFENYDIRNDTLFLENIPKALIIKRKVSILGFTDRELTIKDLISNETGTYYQK